MEITTVELTCETLGETRTFDVPTAQRLLNYQVQKKLNDWQLSDPNFTFENGTISRTNTRNSQKSEIKGESSESN